MNRTTSCVILVAAVLLASPAVAGDKATAAAASADKPDVTTTAPVATANQPAQPIGIRLGLKAGVALPTSKLGAAFLGAVDAEYRLPFLDHVLGVGLELAYTSPSVSGTATDANGQAFDYALDQRIASIALQGVVRRAYGPIEPYGAVGYSILLARARTTSPDSTTTESQALAGFQISGGVGYAVGPGHVFAEARYQFVRLDFESTGNASGSTVSFAAGYRFSF